MVPPSLRIWFVIHFVADMLFAVPLLLVPEFLLGFFGWSCVDLISARLVGAALVGIGVQSLLGRNESVETFRSFLNLKIIWSATATLGILASMLQGAPPFGWAFFGIFLGFNLVWTHYRIRLGLTPSAPAGAVSP